ncbi:peptidoglycan binding domain-containing protein [Kitasatospora sp. NPDC057223]|uniref:peptidoglycan binding domain-containing protein n=1 Tax=Kitasatospora sp. NPDC057223 TaxID=3346055 RepID=UPI00362A7AF4
MSSRESDNAYPTPRRTGPDAYPSGTPPYGIPGIPDDGGAAGGTPSDQAGDTPAGDGGDAPRTETTLTTRVRINIPGSRPIPPVVVRSAVKNEEPVEEAPAAPEPAGPRHRSAAPSSPVLGVMDSSARTATPPNLPPEWQTGENAGQSDGESTGEWFRPRQRKGAADGPAPVPAGAPSGGNPAPAAGRPAEGRQAAAPRPEAARPSGPRPTPGPPPTGAPASPFGAPASPEAPRTGSSPYDDGMPADPFAGDPYAADPYPASPYAADQFANDPLAGGQPAGDRFPPGPGAADRSADPFAPGFAPGPDSRRPQGEAPQHGAPRAGMQQGGNPAGPDDTVIGGFEPIRDETPAAAIPGLAQDPFAPAGPGGRFAGAPGAPAGADPFAAKPQAFPAADPFAPADPFAAGPGPGRPAAGGPAPAPAPAPRPAAPEPAAEKPADKPAPKAAPPKRRGRGSKLLVYGIGFLLFAGAAAYGTGLMLNQSDVPKGTVVLGTEIGGSSRDQAIHKLDDTVGKAGQQPVKLKIGEQVLDLDPTAAGLSFDTTGTVDGLTQHSYNPVEVINSLKGGEKAVPPQVKVDRAKLKAALDALAAGSGQGLQEGYVKFSDSGEIVVVPGRAGQAVDSTSAVGQVEQAYRDRAAGKETAPIALTVTAAEPKVSAQALQAAADSLGKAVLNGNVQVLAGVKRFNFGKATAAKALTLVPDDTGKIVPKWDYDQLGALVNGVFDKQKARKDGALAPITAQDVAAGIMSVIDKSGEKDRTFRFTTT